MRAKTVGSNGMGTTSDGSTKGAFVGYRSVIDERGSAVTLLGPIAWSCGIARQGGRCARHTVNHCMDRAAWLKLSKETQAARLLKLLGFVGTLPPHH